jgi:uncharacterized protein YjbI with pentapeptide repeats
MQINIQLIQLVIAYSLAGAFVFTLAVTCGSLVGWVKFESPSQQRKLFAVLIIQLCVACVGFFANFLKFDPGGVQQAILHDYMSARDTSAVFSDFSASKFYANNFSRGLFDKSLFENASFEGARFDGARFQGAGFLGANFSGVDLSEIVTDSDTKLPQIKK